MRLPTPCKYALPHERAASLFCIHGSSIRLPTLSLTFASLSACSKGWRLLGMRCSSSRCYPNALHHQHLTHRWGDQHHSLLAPSTSCWPPGPTWRARTASPRTSRTRRSSSDSDTWTSGSAPSAIYTRRPRCTAGRPRRGARSSTSCGARPRCRPASPPGCARACSPRRDPNTYRPTPRTSTDALSRGRSCRPCVTRRDSIRRLGMSGRTRRGCTTRRSRMMRP